jgi:hypothetical protein
VTFTILIVAVVLFGYFAGRWWALLGAVALGGAMAVIVDPWEVSKLYVGFAWTGVGAIAIGIGVILRMLLRPKRAATPSKAARSRS